VKLLIAALALAGCAPQPQPTPPAMRACNAAPAQGLIGRQASAALAQEAQRLGRAGAVRFLRPGEVVTMEFRADRLNIHLDAQEKVERIACG